MEGHYSVKQAAEILGVSTKTIRNRITTGQLKAVWEDRGKGMSQWWIPMETINAATQTVEVVPVTRQISPAEVGQIIQMAVEEAVQKELTKFREEMDARADQRDQKLMEAIRMIQEERRERQKTWWQRLFGKN